MSNHLAIATVTTGLVRYLQGVVGADVGNAVITAVRPDGPNSGVPEVGVNVFLYQATPNIGQTGRNKATSRARVAPKAPNNNMAGWSCKPR